MKFNLQPDVVVSVIAVTIGFMNFAIIVGTVQGSLKYGNTIHGVLPEDYKWPNATVFYRFGDSFSKDELQVIEQAMNAISTVSCVRFVPWTHQVGYVEITSEPSGCWADTGYHSVGTQLNLGPNCTASLGTILHELMHTLGFLHQHTRADRDQYVEVLYENVIQRTDLLFNFEKIEPWTDFGVPLPYDFDSIMHYSAHMFSRDPDRLATIRPRDGQNRSIGQRDSLSALDIVGINLLYCRGK